MNENDIRGIWWLLKEIDENRIIGSYFKQQLNIRNTDIKRLMIKFANYIDMLENPMMDNFKIPMLPNIIVNK